MLHLFLWCHCLSIWWEQKKSGLLMDDICVLFLLCWLVRLSFVSVVFDFNASLNDVAPVSSIMFPVELMRMKRVNWWWMTFVCCFFCLHHSDLSFWLIRFSSMHHSTLLLLFDQCFCLVVTYQKEFIYDRNLCVSFVSPLRLISAKILLIMDGLSRIASVPSPFPVSISVCKKKVFFFLLLNTIINGSVNDPDYEPWVELLPIKNSRMLFLRLSCC